MKIETIFGALLKLYTFVATAGIIIMSLAIYFYAFSDIISLIDMIIYQQPSMEKIILKSLKAIDSVLLGVIFFIIGLGLFELFIRPIGNLPKWFEVKNIDQLKSMLIKVLVVVMGVSFTGRIVTWDGESDLMGYGIGLAAVIVALSYFLSVKIQESQAK